MDLILICRDALASSLLSNLLLVKEARKSGMDAGVIFTGEALAALSEGAFLWPRELQGQEKRLIAADGAKDMDVPVMGGGQGRQIDVRSMLMKSIEADVPLFACPIWSSLLKLGENLPQGIVMLDISKTLEILTDSKKIIGSF